jgi:hypothetical protein
MTSILHIWDQAGVGCILAKYQEQIGHETLVIKRKGFDKFGIFSYYKGKEVKSFLAMQFLRIAEKLASNYDIIHIHDLMELVPRIKKKYNGKKVILHYHGSRLRNTSQEERENYEKYADLILVSTPDLKDYVDGEYLPNPVDTKLFSHRDVIHNEKVLSFMTESETPEIIEKLLKKQKINLKYETISRKEKPILYEEMPKFLSNYEYLIDLKYFNGAPIPAYSTLGLQALSLGLKVLNHNYEIVEGLPDIHKPENVVQELEKKYSKILK